MPLRAAAPFQLLLTGFEPFGGSAINPSQEVVRAIEAQHAQHDGIELHTRILPVEAKRGPATLVKAIDAARPDAVLCLGESGRAAAITIERLFINLADYRIADNAGVSLVNRAIVADGPAAYFSTLPVQALRDAIVASGVGVEFSLSAGAFLCNHVAYAMLHHLRRKRRAIPAGFVHLPRLPEQVRGGGGQGAGPSMPLDEMVRAVRAMIDALASSPRRSRRGSRAQERGRR